MGIFNADRPLGKMLADAYDLMLLSVLWFVGCLPIVTIVTSTTALLFVCGKKLRGEEIQVGADFYKSYHQNFKMSFPLLLILGIFWFGSLFYLFIGYRSLLQKMTLAWLFIIILIFELVVLTAFILLLFSRYETSIFQLLKKCSLYVTCLSSSISFYFLVEYWIKSFSPFHAWIICVNARRLSLLNQLFWWSCDWASFKSLKIIIRFVNGYFFYFLATFYPVYLSNRCQL